ncbi:MAG: phosphoribosyltransferase family protein [Actinomycetota bacterium]
MSGLVALWPYDPCSRAVILALKNGHRPDLAAVAARALASRIPAVDVVTWVPASGRGRRRRGYDQGAVLAGRLAHRLGVPRRRLLVRVDTAGGRTRSRAERLGGPAIEPVRGVGAGPRPLGRVLLVDDVVTTGGSLASPARALRAAGAGEVRAAVLAVVDPAVAPRCGRGGLGLGSGAL